MNSTANSLTIRGRKFTISIRPDRDHKGSIVYLLTGVRGAHYFTMRNENHPEMMFICDMRQFGMASSMKGVWLSDKTGELLVQMQ